MRDLRGSLVAAGFVSPKQLIALPNLKHFVFFARNGDNKICHRKKSFLDECACTVVNHICNTSVDVDSGRRFISLLTCLFSITVAFICEIGSTLEISFAISPCKFGRADFPSVTHCDFFDLFTSPISNLIFESRRNITKKNIALSSHCRPKSCSFAAM